MKILTKVRLLWVSSMEENAVSLACLGNQFGSNFLQIAIMYSAITEHLLPMGATWLAMATHKKHAEVETDSMSIAMLH